MENKLPYILLAEDDPDDQFAFYEAFAARRSHIAIKFVQDGDELFEFLDACDPAELPVILVLDYKMPLVSGPEILQRLASSIPYSPIPKAVWSSSERKKDIDECLRLGAARYFRKPTSSAELEAIARGINEILLAQLQKPFSG